MERDSILILHNPRSGSRHAIEIIQSLIEGLLRSGYKAEAFDALEPFQQRVDQLAGLNRLRAVVAAGGDGTAAAVATRVPSTTPLWFCPLGTENLLARYLGMTNDPIQTIDSIDQLQTRSLDAGLANGRLFLVMVGVGFDAEVVRLVHTRRSGHIRRWHYAWPILQSLLGYRFPMLKLTELDAESGAASNRPMEAAWYFLLNLPRYAAGLAIAPDARGEDGLIDICAFKRGGALRGLYYFFRLQLGIHDRLTDFSHRRSSKFRIESMASNEARVSYQLDGDWGGYLPLEIECLPGRLCVIEPSARGLAIESGNQRNSA